MKENKNCKIIRDLLPNYMENLTSGETNQYIEEHIEKCGECQKVLESMNGKIKLDKINQEKEIKYLKKIKRRTITIISISLIIIVTIVIFFNKVSMYLQADENGKVDYGKAIYTAIFDNKIKKSKVTNWVVKVKDEGFVPERILIMTFDEKDRCIGIRISDDWKSEEKAKETYDYLMQQGESFVLSNFKLVGNRAVFNYNNFVGKSKTEVIENMKKYYSTGIIEEY